MLEKILDLSREEFSGRVAGRYAAEISRFHRIQASPGFREAARYVADRLREEGVQAQILEFPARTGVSFWSQRSFMEWQAEEAELILYPPDGKPERLCSFRENPMSLIQRSGSTPPEGVRCQIVLVEKGDDPDSYRNVDVRGKVVLSSGDASRIRRLAVDERGALGIVLDNMAEVSPVRDRFDLPDAVQYVSFWPESVEDVLRFGFGFVVSPRTGQKLRALLRSASSPVEVFARVKTSFSEGAMEVVEGFVPGEGDGEVVAMAHLCHPSPGANDNASGAGALIEAAAALQRLISAGKLPRPLRGIRFLWVPEMTGTYAYLAANEERIPRVIAGINLDMVGENQDLCRSVLTVERPPRATPTFAGDVAWSVMKRLTRQATNLAGTASYPLFRWTVAPFSGGSDHYIWSDPTVGVGCPMLIQWPDRFYHTSEDTPDKLDPGMLAIVGAATTTYLYFLATAGSDEAAFIAAEMAAHYHEEVADVFQDMLRAKKDDADPSGTGDTEELRRRLGLRLSFLEERKILDIESLRILGSSPRLERHLSEAIREVRETTLSVWRRALNGLELLRSEDAGWNYSDEFPDLSSILTVPASGESSSLVSEAKSVIAERIFPGPVSVRSSADMPEDLRHEWESFSRRREKERRLFPYIDYWTDGRRSVLEVSALVEAETGRRDTELVLEYVKIMHKLGYYQYRCRRESTGA